MENLEKRLPITKSDRAHTHGYNCARLVVDCLITEGVQIVFGIPGDENADFAMALEDSRDKITCVLVRHESAASFMADVYGRLSRKCGVCWSTLGPGSTNLISGVANGNMDRSPMVAITAQATTDVMHKESHQVTNTIEMFKPVVKWNGSILRPKIATEMVHKAFKLATSEKPGACHLELPEDVAGAPVDPDEIEPFKRSCIRQPVAHEEVIDEALKLVRRSKQPVILAGNGCVRNQATAQLLRFVELTGIGLVSTFMAKGCIPRSHALFLGTVGFHEHDFTNIPLDQSDLIITVGFDFVEYPADLWNPRGQKPILHIDVQEAEVDHLYVPLLEVVSDLDYALFALNERVEREGFTAVEHKWEEKTRKKLLLDIEEYKDDKQEGSIRPQKVIWDIRQAMGASDILLSDVGAHKTWIARLYQCDEPNTCLITNGFCSMGFSLPGAIAAKLAFPDRQVVAVCGDGGFLMQVQEMETAIRLRINIVVVVWVDNAYGMEVWKQETHFGGGHSNLEFGNPDFILLAKSFGWAGFHVNDSKDFASILDQALSMETPSLIAVTIDYRENELLTKRLGELRLSQ